MKTLKTILISLITTCVGFYLMYSYLPLSWIEKNVEPVLGATITTILGSDTLSASRTVINTNFTNLNNDKLETSATSSDNITNLPNLVEVGALASGSLTTGFTAVPVALGGTGTTSPAEHAIIFGNGANGFKTIGFGTSGQFLTSNGTASTASWTTSSVDEAGNYAWTGLHSFAATTTLATTTITGLTVTGTTTMATTTINGEYPAINKYLTASANLKISADTATTTNSNGTYILVKEVIIPNQGLVNVVFDLKGDGTYNGYARVYVNDVATGPERNVAPDAYATQATSSIRVYNGDRLQLYYKVDGPGIAGTRNFRVLYDETAYSDYAIILN